MRKLPSRRGSLIEKLIDNFNGIMLAVPLSGWVHHAAVEGFAPILWPFGQNLPFVAKSETVATIATTLHWLFSKLLIASVALLAFAMKTEPLSRSRATTVCMHRKKAA